MDGDIARDLRLDLLLDLELGAVALRDVETTERFGLSFVMPPAQRRGLAEATGDVCVASKAIVSRHKGGQRRFFNSLTPRRPRC